MPVHNVENLGLSRQWEWGVAPDAVVVVVACCRGHWWVRAQSPCELRVARFCMTLGPPLVDGGGGGGTRCLPIMVAVAFCCRGRQWVVAIAHFCVMWRSALGIGVSRGGRACQIGDSWVAYLYTTVAVVTPGRCCAHVKCCGSSWVVACASRKDCIGCSSGLWLGQ